MIAVALLWLAMQAPAELRHHVEAGLKAKQSGHLDVAIAEFKRVVELAPTLAAAHVNLGAVYFEKKDYGNAVSSLRKALELNPDLPGAHSMLGVGLLAQGYAAESIPHLEKAGSGELLGVALLESGRTREAIDKLEMALAQKPGDADLLYYLSRALGSLSKQMVERLAQTHPHSARTRQLMAESHAAAGNREAAEKEYRAALASRPDLRGIHLALGELYLTAGDYEGAEREFRAEARMAPGSAVAAYRLGFVLLQRGLVPEALAELKRADNLQPDMPETLFELGRAMAATGDLPEAEKFLRRVLDHEQTSRLAESAHYQLAQIYRKLGRTADSEREMKRFQDLKNARQ